MLCTDEAERRQRFPDETRDLTLNVEYQSCAPQHAPVVQRIEQGFPKSLKPLSHLRFTYGIMVSWGKKGVDFVQIRCNSQP